MTRRWLPSSLLGRLALFAAILAADCALMASIPHAVPLLGPLAPFGIVSFAVFLGLGYRQLKQQPETIEFRTSFFLTHLLFLGALTLADLAALRDPRSWLNATPALLGAGLVLLAGIILLALACLPLRVWRSMAADTAPAWHYAVLAGIAAWFLRVPFQSLWIHASAPNVYLLQVVAFRAVQGILGLILPDLAVDSGPFVIGTPRFSVSVGAPCSGIEGLGLVLVFTIVWLWFFRRENLFPRALLLIPCALICVFVLNILRIAVLILIGNAGAPEVAFVGFHSQAGWIAFTLVALGFSMATQRLQWFRKAPESDFGGGSVSGSESPQWAGAGAAGIRSAAPEVESRELVSAESPATAAYLVPFLAILGASFLSKSASGYFEWLYPLRFVAALMALWLFRREYRKLNWRFGWAAPATGAAIFLIWIAPEWWTHGKTAGTLGAALSALSPQGRTTWIVLRTAAAVITVPLAEELAFRGYLARRLMGRRFEEIPFMRMSVLAIGLSSVAFGAMHGQHWMVGLLAGLAYAGLLKSKGRMGDAVIAHAVSNLLLAAWVLTRGDWGMW